LKHVQSYYKEPVQKTSGYVSKNDPTYDGVDMTGKVVVITGANSGLGKEVATYVTSKGAKVYMLCRSVERAQNARDDIIKAATGTDSKDVDNSKDVEDRVQILAVDVGELSSVRTVVKELQQREPSIHCLVCNAGVLLNEQQNTVDQQLESTFASHLLGGTYLLTSLLLPQLQSTPDSRVVVVTSGGMYTTPLPNWDVMTSYTSSNPASSAKPKNFKYDGTMAYAYAKRGQVALVEEWSKQFASSDSPKFVTVHPGWTDTPAVADAFGDNAKYLQPLREPWQGAEGVAWCTAVPSSQLVNGALYLDRQVQKKHIAGPFMSEGSFTKNSPIEIQAFMNNLKLAAGL
jgi:dehydrogenase/reductase SDR family member 12